MKKLLLPVFGIVCFLLGAVVAYCFLRVPQKQSKNNTLSVTSPVKVDKVPDAIPPPSVKSIQSANPFVWKRTGTISGSVKRQGFHVYRAPVFSQDGQHLAVLVEEKVSGHYASRLEIWDPLLTKMHLSIPVINSELVGFSPDGHRVLLVANDYDLDNKEAKSVQLLIISLELSKKNYQVERIEIPYPEVQNPKEQYSIFEAASWFSNQEIAVCLKSGLFDFDVGSFICRLYKQEKDRWFRKRPFLDTTVAPLLSGTQVSFVLGQRKGLIFTDENKIVLFDEKGRVTLPLTSLEFFRLYGVSPLGQRAVFFKQRPEVSVVGYDLLSGEKRLYSTKKGELRGVSFEGEGLPWVSATYIDRLDVFSWGDMSFFQTIPVSCSLVGGFFSKGELYGLCGEGTYYVFGMK